MKALMAMILCLSAVSCLKQIYNGKIPKKYVELARDYMGSYSTSFEGKVGTLKISMDQERVVYAAIEGFFQGDLIGVGCDSEIQKLATVKIKKLEDKTRVLEWLDFSFDPNKCQSDFGGDYQTLRVHFESDSANPLMISQIRVVSHTFPDVDLDLDLGFDAIHPCDIRDCSNL